MKVEFDSDKGTANVQYYKRSTILKYPCTSVDSCSPYKVTFSKGAYRIELWGASAAARGGYTRGDIYFRKEETFYFHIGPSNGFYNSVPPYASIHGGVRGSGATDMRYSPDIYYNFDSLKTRIMVAAGSGTWEYRYGVGMNAGGLIGEEGNATFLSGNTSAFRSSPGGCQTNGGITDNNWIYHVGIFGLAGYVNSTSDWGANGGGGYYGGTSINIEGASGGGSSFISGHEGCDAIFENSTENNIFHSHQPDHYSRYIFVNTHMSSGKERAPIATGGYEIGHRGNGTVRITPLIILSDYRTCTKRRKNISFFLFIIQFIST